MEYIKNRNFTWERECKISEIPIRELELLAKQYNISPTFIKITISDPKPDKKKKPN
jgi:hypothetical protein